MSAWNRNRRPKPPAFPSFLCCPSACVEAQPPFQFTSQRSYHEQRTPKRLVGRWRSSLIIKNRHPKLRQIQRGRSYTVGRTQKNSIAFSKAPRRETRALHQSPHSQGAAFEVQPQPRLPLGPAAADFTLCAALHRLLWRMACDRRGWGGHRRPSPRMCRSLRGNRWLAAGRGRTVLKVRGPSFRPVPAPHPAPPPPHTPPTPPHSLSSHKEWSLPSPPYGP